MFCPYLLKISKKLFSSLERHVNIQRNRDKVPISQRILKTDPCPYVVKYSVEVLKKKTNIRYF